MNNYMSLKTFAALLALLITLMVSAWDKADDKAQFRILGEYMYRLKQCPKHNYTTKPSGCKWHGDGEKMSACIKAYYHANIGEGESACEARAREIKNLALRGVK